MTGDSGLITGVLSLFAKNIFSSRTSPSVLLSSNFLGYLANEQTSFNPSSDLLFTNKFQSTHPGFNPHTPLGVRLLPPQKAPPSTSMFQSTHPVRGATGCHWQLRRFWLVSIHTSRKGCDTNSFAVWSAYNALFQSTHPVRGATAAVYCVDFLSTHL